MSKKEEQSKAYIKPIILDRNKKYLKEDNWELGLEYTDFTGYEVQCAFEDGWDAAMENIIKNSFITEFWWIKPIMYATSDLRLPDIDNDDKVRVITIKEE